MTIELTPGEPAGPTRQATPCHVQGQKIRAPRLPDSVTIHERRLSRTTV